MLLPVPVLMESPDVVDTSDVEEREDFAISDGVDHWAIPVASPKSVATERTPVSLSTRHGREGEGPSPRKRIKVRYIPWSPYMFYIDVASKIAHDVGCAYSITAEASFLNNSPQKVVPIQELLNAPSQQPQEDTLIGDDEGRSSLSLPRDASPYSDWNSLFSSPSRPSVERNSLDSTSWAGPQNPPSHSLSRSLSTSTDHHFPFSSPRRWPTTPPQTSSQRSHDQFSPGPRLATSSPLTSASSPVLPVRTPSSPDPLQLLSPHRSQTLPSRSSPPPVILPRVPSPPVEIPEDPQPLGRYSLRRRQARQLNPYAYDKLLYKQQLKSHPDAIVKFRSPRRHSGAGGVGEDGTQDEYVFPLDNLDEDGSGRRKRRRARSLDRNNELGGNSPRQATRQVEGWLPETLKGLSSSDEEDTEIRKLARRVRREREKAEALARAQARRAAAMARQDQTETMKATKRRPKPFPVHLGADPVSVHFSGPISIVSLLIQYFVVSLKADC